MTAQEIPGGVRAIDLEALMGAAVRVSQAHVVKHRPRVEKLSIELEAMTLSGERAPVIDTARMVEQQPGLRMPDHLRDLAGEATAGYLDTFDRKCLLSRDCHFVSPAE